MKYAVRAYIIQQALELRKYAEKIESTGETFHATPRWIPVSETLQLSAELKNLPEITGLALVLTFRGTGNKAEIAEAVLGETAVRLLPDVFYSTTLPKLPGFTR